MGIDHHKQYSHITLVNREGEVIKSGRVSNFRREVEEFLEGVNEEIVAVIEAGRSSYAMVDLIKGMGIQIKVAHPKELRAIALVATEIADLSRFSTVGSLHCYAGVIPSTYSSGERLYHGKIVKEGNRWLRWAAVEAVWPAIRSDFACITSS